MFQEKAETASYIDNGLKGANGAAHVLQLLAPRINELVLSHNNLGDEGVRVLCEGLVKLRRQYNFPGILELNLTANGISDKGLYYIVQHLLLSSPPPKSTAPILTRLYLSNNKILLSPNTPLPSLLAAALSHPESRLQFLSLISNEGLHLGFLKNCTPTSLRTLQIDTCALSDYRSIMSFLKRPDGGGRLEHLRANGNFLGAKGVRRLARLVADGHNTSLVRFEMSANSAPTSEANSRSVSDDEGDAARQRRTQTTRASATEDVLLNSSDDDEGGENPLELDNGVDVASVFMIPGLVKALNRNSVLRDITQTSALRLLPYARILMIAKPAIGANEKEVMDMLVDATGIGHLTMSTEALQLDSTMDAPIPVFPWLSLPSEIRRLVLRHLGSVIEQSRAQSMIDVIQTRLPPKYRQDLVLSRRQFGKLLEFASDRSTLGQKLDMRYTLRAVGCERWEVDDF